MPWGRSHWYSWDKYFFSLVVTVTGCWQCTSMASTKQGPFSLQWLLEFIYLNLFRRELESTESLKWITFLQRLTGGSDPDDPHWLPKWSNGERQPTHPWLFLWDSASSLFIFIHLSEAFPSLSTARKLEQRNKWWRLKCDQTSASRFGTIPNMLRWNLLLMWRGNWFPNGGRGDEIRPPLIAIHGLLLKPGCTSRCTLGIDAASSAVCFFVECSWPARRELFSGDVQAGPSVRLPLHWAGLLERSHHWGRACHYSRFHHDNGNII